jgi:hypothetical protein
LSVVAGFRGDEDGSRILKPTTLCHDAEGRRLSNSTFLVHLHAFTFRVLCLKRTLYQSFICQMNEFVERGILDWLWKFMSCKKSYEREREEQE